MLKIDEIAVKLNVHRNTVINLIKCGKIGALRVGDQYRVSEDSFQNFLEENEIMSMKDLNSKLEEDANKLKVVMFDLEAKSREEDKKFRDENNLN